MIHDIPKPKISRAFTIADIHKIRAWNYERLKDATVSERLADNKRRAAEARRYFKQHFSANAETALAGATSFKT